jgi:signal transduction histidine kinase
VPGLEPTGRSRKVRAAATRRFAVVTEPSLAASPDPPGRLASGALALASVALAAVLADVSLGDYPIVSTLALGLYPAGFGASALVCWQTARAGGNRRVRRAWKAVSAAVGAVAIAVLGVHLARSAGPAWIEHVSDLVAVAFYPLMAVGLARLVSPQPLRSSRLKLALDVAIVFWAVFAFTSYLFVRQAELAPERIVPPQFLYTWLQPAVACATVAAAIALVLSRRTLVSTPALALLLAAVALVTTIDLLDFTPWAIPSGSRGAWAAAGWFIALAAWVEGRRAPWPEEAAAAGNPDDGRAIPYSAVVLLMAIVVIEVAALESARARALVFGLLVLAALVIGRLLVTLREVGELTRAKLEQETRFQAKLAQSQKLEAIGRLAGGVAHDFNNLLTAISGFAELLEADLEEGAGRIEDVREIRRAASRASELTSQLLTFARRQVVAPRVVSVNGLVTDVSRMLTRLLGEQIDLRLELTPARPYACVDPAQLEQVLVNLAINARDAMPRGGRLTIATSVASRVDSGIAEAGRAPDPTPWVRLSVVDTGTGMTPEVASQIFEPFFTTKPMGQGTGLGLAMAYGAVMQAGGRITVDTVLGEGSAFHVWLPLVFAEAAEEAGAAHVERPGASNGRGRVLLVEDEESVRTLASRLLRGLGYRVEIAATGVEAVARSQADGPFDVLVTDVVMPGMNGREVAAALRARQPGLPVLFISGHSADVLDIRPDQDSRIDFLAKPFTKADLAERLQTLLDQPRAG